MREFDAFAGYPQPKEPRRVGPALRTINNRIIASYRDHEFYDGDRMNGYGGMVNDGRWGPIAQHIKDSYHLNTAKVLQVGAHKGFLLHELFTRGQRVFGTEISDYAIEHSMYKLDKAPPTDLPYDDKEFDFVIGANVVYTMGLSGAIKSLKEIQRVGKRAWISLAAYENEDDIEGLMLMRYWMLLGTTILTKADWIAVMEHCGYTGDYKFDTAKTLRLVRE